jgi:lipoprotein-anchoring transpeptidase ErfK/SrfK
MLLVIVVLVIMILWQLGVFGRAADTVGDIASTTTNSLGPIFLHDEEGVILDGEVVLPVEDVLFEYVRVTGGCGPFYEGECLRVRSGPGMNYPVVYRLRNEVVLKVGGKVENDGLTWYKIVFDEWLRYPDRIQGDWYVASDYVEVLHDEGDKTTWDDGVATSTTNKKIIVDRSEQKLYAYEGESLVMEILISTGLELTPTPRGTFTVFKKTPSRYMQGPLPGLVDQQVYDLPGVPWNLYFTQEGAVIHGAFWHKSFGRPYSHGCVNVPPLEARELYAWADLGIKVIVRD